MERRGFLRVATIGVLGAATSRPASASLGRALPLETLVERSRHIVLAEPLESSAVWERIGTRRHIVTYTRIRPLELLSAGSPPEQSELWVRTLGGRVGELGELVPGEAMINVGERSLLFMMPTERAWSVTAMAQGHYPLSRDASGIERLRRSPQTSELASQASSAVERLHGLPLDRARGLLRSVGQK